MCMCDANETDDFTIANAQSWLRNFSTQKVQLPFFLAVGLHRPHLPWSVPQKFFELYNASSLATAKHQLAPKGMPPIAWHSCSREEGNEFLGCIPRDTDAPDHPATVAQQQRTRHGYYAATSYADDRVGMLLDTLNSTGFYSTTIVAVHGDVSVSPLHAECNA